jgi:hypothetical protein
LSIGENEYSTKYECTADNYVNGTLHQLGIEIGPID